MPVPAGADEWIDPMRKIPRLRGDDHREKQNYTAETQRRREIETRVI